MSCVQNKKPPLGLKPRHIHDSDRVSAIRNAVNRMFDDDLPIPSEWVEEYNHLIKVWYPK